jgi:hypothetical protein
VQEIFEANKSKNLHGVIVWIPMLETDNFEGAAVRETKFSDPRVKQFWDQDRVFGRLLSQTLNLNEPIAWDVYLVYPTAHSWVGELPPMPMFWMHQLNEEPTLLLDLPRLKEYVKNY